MAQRGRPRQFDRDQALRQAMNLFRERGYDGASLGELTQAMGISPPSLYAAFGCKEALFREALALYSATEGSTTARALSEPATAREAIEAMLRDAARAFTAQQPGRGCLVVLGAPHRTGENAEIFDDLVACREQTQKRIRARLQRGIADGDVPAGADVAALAAYYATVLNGLSLQVRDGAPRKRLLSVVDCAMASWDCLVGADG
ncbi:TetR/AcrR family transcriptional regulator [Luteimonas aquatica]|uniref:TetR/AcrR family transcriptional regulator n=1 Tax=Luteimonas aquatica TaxID=450364 RepID=UPI001F5ABDAC|nr:TetR/AcrR family transcriptional regulator [Luteimonas aquatica]